MARNPLADAVGLPGDELVALVAALRERGETVATAESLTGGLVAAALTSVAGSSAVVRGGLVVYATALKAELAGVDADLLAEHGPVHPAVAERLAEGARRACGASCEARTIGVDGNRHQVRSAAVRAAFTLLRARLDASPQQVGADPAQAGR